MPVVLRLNKTLLLIVMATILGCLPVAPQPTTTQPITPADWMGGNLPTLANRTLGDLTLPASHDSAMYQSTFPQSLARTQSLSIYQQLTAGVRYFDLRPQFKGGQFFIHHGSMTGPALSEILGDVRRFMLENHRELILLKFSHYDGISSASYPAMIQQFQDQLGPWLFRSLPPNKRLIDITLGQYLHDGGRVLILCDGGLPRAMPHPGIWIYRVWDSRDPQLGDLRVYDQYSNTMSYEAMKADQLAKFAAYDGRCKNQPEVPCDLFLLSWTLTPPTGVLTMAKEANDHLGQVLDHMAIINRVSKRINLLYVDDAGSWLTKIALRLNQSTAVRDNARSASRSRARSVLAQ